MQRQRFSLLYFGLISAFSLATFDLYQPALPSITKFFDTTQARGQLTLSLFFLIFGLSQLIWGPIIDHFGRRKSLDFSLLIFFIATIGCIYSNSINQLILARSIQGFAVCCLSVVSFSSARDYDDSGDRAKILSHMAMIVSVSPIFAPLVGSLIFMRFQWQGIFVFMAILALFIYIISPWFLHESPHWEKEITGFNLRKSLNHYKRILGSPHFIRGALIISASYSCVMILIVNASYLMINGLHYSPLAFSIFFAFNGLMLIIGNFIGIKLRKIRSLEWNIRAGSLIMMTGSILVLLSSIIWGLTLSSFYPVLIINLAVSITNPPAFSLVLSDYTKEAGTATAVLNTLRMTIASIIGAIVASLLVYSYMIFGLGLLICSSICWFLSKQQPSTELEQ